MQIVTSGPLRNLILPGRGRAVRPQRFMIAGLSLLTLLLMICFVQSLWRPRGRRSPVVPLLLEIPLLLIYLLFSSLTLILVVFWLLGVRPTREGLRNRLRIGQVILIPKRLVMSRFLTSFRAYVIT